MDLQIVSKNNIGIVATLILVILLSQSRFFGFLTETPLGRMFLLAMTIFIAYSNKIFGLLAVIFIILAFNLNQIISLEGFNIVEGARSRKKSKKSKKLKKKQYCVEGKCYSSKAEYEEAMNKDDDEDMEDEDIDMEDEDTEAFITASSSASSDSREGFCMCDRELNIIRGKPSNTVPVFSNSREQSDEVNPSDKSVFSSDYALI
jgi:hypothetical protein